MWPSAHVKQIHQIPTGNLPGNLPFSLVSLWAWRTEVSCSTLSLNTLETFLIILRTFFSRGLAWLVTVRTFSVSAPRRKASTSFLCENWCVCGLPSNFKKNRKQISLPLNRRNQRMSSVQKSTFWFLVFWGFGIQTLEHFQCVWRILELSQFSICSNLRSSNFETRVAKSGNQSQSKLIFLFLFFVL